MRKQFALIVIVLLIAGQCSADNRLGKAFREDPIIRPTSDGLDGCYFYTAFNAATQATLNSVNLVQPRTGN